MKIILLSFLLLAALPAFSNDDTANPVITGPEAEKMFNELNGSEYSAAAITENLEYRMIVRSNEAIKCQKSITTYKLSNQVEIEFECTNL